MTQSEIKPGWYRINDRNHFQYFDGKSLDKSDFKIIDVSEDVKFFIGPKKGPRTKPQRFLLILLGWLTLIANFFLIGVFTSFSGAVIETNSIEGFARVVGLILIAVMCKQVGYRWFDTFFCLIPFYGVYFIGKIMWRGSVLPHRYWNLRGSSTIYELDLLKSSSISDSVEPFEVQDESIRTSDSTDKPANNSKARKSFESKLKLNKPLAFIIVLALLVPSFIFVSQKSGLFNSFQCKGLKSELAQQDIVGRDLWNSYQMEVSNLNNFRILSSQWYNQVGNIARRTIQVLESDKTGYMKILEKPYCAKDSAEIERRLATVESNIAFLNGVELGDDGERWSVYKGWNSDFYSNYYDFSTLLK